MLILENLERRKNKQKEKIDFDFTIQQQLLTFWHNYF